MRVAAPQQFRRYRWNSGPVLDNVNLSKMTHRDRRSETGKALYWGTTKPDDLPSGRKDEASIEQLALGWNGRSQ
jgi:hypothetical protein